MADGVSLSYVWFKSNVMCPFFEATISDGYPVPRYAGALCNGLIRSLSSLVKRK